MCNHSLVNPEILKKRLYFPYLEDEEQYEKYPIVQTPCPKCGRINCCNYIFHNRWKFYYDKQEG